MLDPSIVLKNVNKQQDLTKIAQNLCNINQQLAGCADQIKVLFATKSNGPTHNIYMRISPKVYKIFAESIQLFLNYEAIKWTRTIHVKQCQHCLMFNPNHRTKDCDKPKVCKTCGKCGPHDCDRIQKCGNCMNHPHHSKNCHHKPDNTECPIYAAQHNKIVQFTCYNPEISSNNVC